MTNSVETMRDGTHVQYSELELDLARSLGVATLHEAAGQVGALPSMISCRTTGLKIAGPAFPVLCGGFDNFWLHQAVYAATPGEILVVSVGGAYEAGYWGEILSWAAHERGLGGVVIDGCVRDQAQLQIVGLPIFARGLCVRGTTKRTDGAGAIGQPLLIGDVPVYRGDLVVGDEDGVVVLPKEVARVALEKGEERVSTEDSMIKAIRKGETTLDLYSLSGSGYSSSN